MTTVYNFSAGPAVLPKEVLQKAQKELLNFQDSGMSVMEMSHRSAIYNTIIEHAETSLRELMSIPDNYKVLFLQGGASLQFSMIPMNLAANRTACYINTGSWSKKAISEAKKIPNVEVEVLASSEDKNFSYIPTLSNLKFPEDSAYLHITTNNTIEGTAYYDLPDTGNIPLVADMSSNILAVNYDVSKFGMIYAGAQKNIGPAGLTVVIVRDDLIGQTDTLSAMLDYKVQADNGSLYNTPPTYGIYIAGLVFDWLKTKGGIDEMEKEERYKAKLLYDTIDNSKLFSSPVRKEDRSITNIPFVTGNDDLDAKFIKEAKAIGLENLKGHRSVGGMRASIYNAMPVEGVEVLVNFMNEFEKNNGGN